MKIVRRPKKLHKPRKKKPKLKISFCIPCMGRLHHLQETLPKNIEESSSYDAEFIVLDYNSSDGLERWMKGNMMSHIKSGKVVYYKTIEPKYFKMSLTTLPPSIFSTIYCRIFFVIEYVMAAGIALKTAFLKAMLDAALVA